MKTTRTKYIDEEALKTAPTFKSKKPLQFFKLDRYISDDELEKEYIARNLIPATPEMINAYDKAYPKKMDDMRYVSTHWKDADGEWCYAAFCRWDDGVRSVRVGRHDFGWSDFWWFAGLASTLNSNPKPSSDTLPSDLESRLLKVEQWINNFQKGAEELKSKLLPL